MTKYEDLENRIIMIEKEINCRNLENRIIMIEKEINCRNLENKLNILESEVKHLKEALQYQLRKKK